MSGRRLLTMREVGERLGHGYHWFRKRRHRMQREHGFPEPIRTCGLRWDPDAIDVWLKAQREPQNNITLAPNRDLAVVLDTRAERIAARH